MSDALGPATPDDLLVLLAVRLRSRGQLDAVSATVGHLGGDAAQTAVFLRGAEELGQVRHRGTPARWSLTPAGEAESAALLSLEIDGPTRADLTTAYEAFLPVNRTFLTLLSQPGPSPAAGLTADAVSSLVDELRPILDALAGHLARFGSYRSRFAGALQRIPTDPRYLDGPSVDSVHTIWFELHEHLLATLGRARTDER